MPYDANGNYVYDSGAAALGGGGGLLYSTGSGLPNTTVDAGATAGANPIYTPATDWTQQSTPAFNNTGAQSLSTAAQTIANSSEAPYVNSFLEGLKSSGAEAGSPGVVTDPFSGKSPAEKVSGAQANKSIVPSIDEMAKDMGPGGKYDAKSAPSSGSILSTLWGAANNMKTDTLSAKLVEMALSGLGSLATLKRKDKELAIAQQNADTNSATLALTKEKANRAATSAGGVKFNGLLNSKYDPNIRQTALTQPGMRIT